MQVNFVFKYPEQGRGPQCQLRHLPLAEALGIVLFVQLAQVPAVGSLNGFQAQTLPHMYDFLPLQGNRPDLRLGPDVLQDHVGSPAIVPMSPILK